MSLSVSQIEYITYSRYLKEVKNLEKWSRKELCSSVFEKFSAEEIKNKIDFINSIHCRLKEGGLKERKSDDCAPLAADLYNTYLKTISAWNSIFTKEKLNIHLPNDQEIELLPEFAEMTLAQARDEKALTSYFELLKNYPKLKRQEDLNDYTKGVYQSLYDRKEIQAVRQEVYQRLYEKAKSQGMTSCQADDIATEFSRPGVVCEDQFWLWIRDAVVSPQGYKHTYNRIVWKCDLERVGGAATLPIVIDHEDNKKFIVQLVFRHATNSWEFEIPRGASKHNENPEDTAKREILEETGCETDQLVALGSITPDSGLTASVVPVFLGIVSNEKEAKHDKTEAIKGKYAFTLKELMEGLKKGHMEVEINNQMTQVPIRDPFLTYALLMAQYNGQL